MADSDLEFDPSALQDRGETYSSLTDINEIAIFTKSFEEQVLIVKERESIQDDFLMEQPFTTAMAVDDSEEEIISVLFRDSKQNVIKAGEKAAYNQNGLLISCFGLAFAVFLALMIVYCRARNRKTEDEKQHMLNEFVYGGD